MLLYFFHTVKPRRPIIISVIRETNGDFSINLNTTYTKEPFSKSLMVELVYGIYGSHDNVSHFTLFMTQSVYECKTDFHSSYRWRSLWKLRHHTRSWAGTFNLILNIFWEQEWNQTTTVVPPSVTTVNLMCSEHVSFIRYAWNHLLSLISIILQEFVSLFSQHHHYQAFSRL